MGGGGKPNAGIEPPVHHWTPDWIEHIKHRGLDLCALWIMLSSSCRIPRPTTVFTSWASFVVFLLSERAGIPQVGRCHPHLHDWNQDVKRAKTSVCPWVFHQKCMSVHMSVCICKSHVWDLVLRKDLHWPWLRPMGCTVSLLAHNDSVFTFPWSHFILNMILRLSQVKVTKNLNWNFGIIFGAILGLFFFFFLLTYLLWIQRNHLWMSTKEGEKSLRVIWWQGGLLECWIVKIFLVSSVDQRLPLTHFRNSSVTLSILTFPCLQLCWIDFWSCLLYKIIFVVKVSHRSE